MTITISEHNRDETGFLGEGNRFHTPTFSTTSLQPMHSYNNSFRRIRNTTAWLNLHPRVMRFACISHFHRVGLILSNRTAALTLALSTKSFSNAIECHRHLVFKPIVESARPTLVRRMLPHILISSIIWS